MTIRYKKYLVKADDHFDESDYLWLQDELETLKKRMEKISPNRKVEIIDSIIKDHHFKKEKIDPPPADHINSNSFVIQSLAELFDSGSGNETFRLELETYVRKILN